MQFRHVSRDEGLVLQSRDSVLAIDVSSYSETHAFLSPYTWGKDIRIYVPGMPGEFAHSVEGIWQGLKIVEGRIDKKYFTMRPRKRRGVVSGHQLGNEILGLVEAREVIYIPVYFSYLESYVDAGIFEDWLDVLIGGRQVVFFDTESNGDIRVDEHLAHSAVLSTYMNLLLWARIPEKYRRPPSESPRRDLGSEIEDFEPPAD